MEFGIVYTASEGAFQMEVFTGEVIRANCRVDAMRMVERLEQEAHPYQELSVSAQLSPKAQVQILPGSTLAAKPCVLQYAVLTDPLALRVFVPDDFETVTVDEFLRRLQEEYAGRTEVSFEWIAYGVEDMVQLKERGALIGYRP